MLVLRIFRDFARKTGRLWRSARHVHPEEKPYHRCFHDVRRQVPSSRCPGRPQKVTPTQLDRYIHDILDRTVDVSERRYDGEPATKRSEPVADPPGGRQAAETNALLLLIASSAS
jgi:hypothetical protein